jgi:hypothetical protein
MQRHINTWCALLALLFTLAAGAQTTPNTPVQPPPATTSQQPPAQQPKDQPKDQAKAPTPETHITPEQARELFSSIGPILQFASEDTKLPVKHQVKPHLTTRNDVEKYLLEKMKDDKDAKRMERSEIVLKKFGLIDADFHLQSFLVKLLDEQIAAYYDSKTKTVNLLDWIAPDTQKPVLAHELTHALQDQRVNLDKWQSQASDDLSRSFSEDKKHIATDEDDTAREAVLEGQAMAVFVDYSLAPAHRSLRTSPDLVDNLLDDMTDDGDSPVLSRAPRLLQESLLFPYKDGLKFEATLVADSKNPAAAYANVLDRPPASSYEIMNPHAYEQQAPVPLLNMPDIHPILDGQYNPYDIGVMGELDVRILAELFADDQVAADLTPAWDGGIYYAAQKKDAPDKDSTASVALFYLSQWKSKEAATAFVQVYAGELSRKYEHVSRDSSAEMGPDEQVYQTNEGPVLITTSGKDVFISESFDLTTARKLQIEMLSGQNIAPQKGDMVASARRDTPTSDPAGSMVRFMAGCGMMKVALAHHLY